MKKFIAIILASISIFSCFGIIAGATTAGTTLYGDVNLNGAVGVDDARLCLRYAIKIDSIGEKTGYMLKKFNACDIDNDGEITVSDARNILRIAIGLDESCEKIMPTTKEDIMSFYKESTNRVANGDAGYTKKEYQTTGNLNLTGVSICDSAINKIMYGILTDEESAPEQVSAKGSYVAKDRWSANCTLTDYSFIKYATCIKDGANYKIKIVTGSEDTPKKSGSVISSVSQDILYWEDVEREISNYASVIKEYDDIHIKYISTTIDAEITPEGEIICLNVCSGIDVVIGSAKILVSTINNKTFHIDTYDKFYDFDYVSDTVEENEESTEQNEYNEIPDIIGCTLSDAIDILNCYGYIAIVVKEYNEYLPGGTVISAEFIDKEEYKDLYNSMSEISNNGIVGVVVSTNIK